MTHPGDAASMHDAVSHTPLTGCAAVTRRELAQAKILIQTFHRHHPQRPFYLLVVDGIVHGTDMGPNVHVLTLADLRTPAFTDLACTFELNQLAAAVKPSLLALVLERFGEDALVVFDASVVVMRPLVELQLALQSAGIVMVPRILKPLPHQNRKPNDRDILIRGAYSDGLLAVRKSKQSLEFLQWWERHNLVGEGIVTAEGPVFYPYGIVHSAKWLDLVPTLFSEAALLRDETYDVAWWNLHHRLIAGGRDVYRVNGRPMTTFHFDQFDPFQPDQLTGALQNRHVVVPGSPLAGILERYAAQVSRHDFLNCGETPTDHVCFENGIFGHLLLRQLYMGLSDVERENIRSRLNKTELPPIVSWATSFSPSQGPLSPFLRFIHGLRGDLSVSFPDIEGADRRAFLEWARTHGSRELGFHPALADPNAVGIKAPCGNVTAYQIKRDTREAATSNSSATGFIGDDLSILPRFAPASLPRIATPRPRCSIVIPVHGKAALTRQCLDSLLSPPHEKATYEIIVVDDASPDDTSELLSRYGPRIRVATHSVNQGFAQTCNDGACIASGEFLVFLNNDTIPRPGWLDALVRYQETNQRIGAVGSKLLYPNGTIQHAGTVILQDRFPRHVYVGFPADHPAVNKSRRFQAVTAASMLISRRLFEEIGGFDTGFVNSYEDVDLCLRLGQRGMEVHYCHESVLYHLESVTRAQRIEEDERNARTYLRRWGHRVRPDDIEYYFEDGLLAVDRGNGPPRLTLSPYLAIACGTEAELRTDRLIVRRSAQLLELLKENVHLNVRIKENEFRSSRQSEWNATATNGKPQPMSSPYAGGGE